MKKYHSLRVIDKKRDKKEARYRTSLIKVIDNSGFD